MMPQGDGISRLECHSTLSPLTTQADALICSTLLWREALTSP